jgi:hypothetical protein
MGLISKLKPTVNIAFDEPEDGPSNPKPPTPAIEPAATPSPASEGLLGRFGRKYSLATPTKHSLINQIEQAKQINLAAELAAEMDRKGVGYVKLADADFSDTGLLSRWISEHIHHLPVPVIAPPQEKIDGGSIGAGIVTEPLSQEGQWAREQAMKRRREMRHNVYWDSLALPDLSRHAQQDGSTEYRFPKNDKVAFVEKDTTLRFPNVDIEAICCGLQRAAELGWPSISLNGSPEFMSTAFIEASKVGIKVDGYTPTQGDLMKLSALGMNHPSPDSPAANNSMGFGGQKPKGRSPGMA